uniref:GLOBIN domain-containing protein n=1 Tax=Heterorhabditis bacteriophora TaxID=37862 RepID=A0A1I7WL92_HETBA
MGALQLGVLFILLSWVTARTSEKRFDIDMAKRRENAEGTVLEDEGDANSLTINSNIGLIPVSKKLETNEDATPDDEVVFLRMYANPQDSAIDKNKNFPISKRFDPYVKRFDPFSKRFDPFFKRFDYIYKRFDPYSKRFDPLGMEFDLFAPKFDTFQKRFDPYFKRFNPFLKTFNIAKRLGNTDKKRLFYTIGQAKRNIFDPRAYQIGFGR